MARNEKFRARLMAGTADNRIDFADLCRILVSVGFELRIEGSHHIFTRANVTSIVLQPRGPVAKDYQVRQTMKVLKEHDLMNPRIDRYRVEIWWSEIDGRYIAEMPELPGCLADGTTQKEALVNARDTAAAMIKVFREIGRPIPEPQAVAA